MTLFASFVYAEEADKSDFIIEGLFFSNADLALTEGEYDRPIFLKINNSGKEVISGTVYVNITVKDLIGNFIDECEVGLWANWLTNNVLTIRDECILDLPSGNLMFYAKVDSRDDYDELDDTNNDYQQQIEIVPLDFSCSDDDGDDRYVSGTTTGYDSDSLSTGTFSDYCTTGESNSCEEVECPVIDQVIEYVCSRTNNEPNNNVAYGERDCPNGCFDGACLITDTPPEHRCCIINNICYSMSAEEIEDDCDVKHPGECTLKDNCYAVHECYPGDTISCEIENLDGGTQTCNENAQFGPCILTDETTLLLIDSDSDGDPDSTDCAPENQAIFFTNNGCTPELLAPQRTTLIKLILAVLLLIIIILMFRNKGKEQKPKKK